jgi:hypothetical protein
MLKRKVEDRDNAALVRIIISWDAIAPQLLNRGDRTDVEQDGRTAAQKKRMMLEKWEDRNGDAATFDGLITAMLDAGELGQATEVCQLLNPGAVPSTSNGAAHGSHGSGLGAVPSTSNGAAHGSHGSGLDGEPDLTTLGSLTKRDGTTFSVIEQLGRDYNKFGTQLLEDKKGTIMDEIADDFSGSTKKKTEMFKKWMSGTGLTPKTWGTLVNLLESPAINLGTLAADIRDALQ